jgi:conjugative relaxase-like TrwC/TraI family protein
MVSITNVTSGQAEHYYQKDNYYTNQQGEWQGKGAEELGLQGEIKKEDFLSLVRGKAPDGSFGIQKGGEGQEHRAGVDLTFSAPKSVSIASEVLGDSRVREAHEKAVTETLKYVEANYSQARQTKDGVTERVDTGNLVIAKFEHNVSRELDPQLHTHAVVMNMTRREDGQWRALSNEEIFEHKMLIGQIYRNELAKNLKEIGYSIQSNEKGFFEIRGISQKLIDHFSRRVEQIKAKVEELRGKYSNTNDQKLKEIATLGSRAAKGDVDMDTVRESWQDRTQEQGYTKEQMQESIQNAAEQERQSENNCIEVKMSEYDIVRQAAKIRTEQESTFSREDILKTAGKLSIGEHRMSDLEKAFNELNKDREIKQLDKNVYTTKEILRLEKQNIKIMLKGQNTKDAIFTKEQGAEAIKAYEQARGFTMTADQKAAVEHILTSKDKISGIQGDAGTGKTTSLAVAREQFEKAGYQVRGLGYTGKAASEIEQASGIKSQTLHSFLSSSRKADDIVKGKEVWIVDEASMLGSKQTNEILKAAAKAEAKVVLVGDTKQLQSISAGRTFKDLQAAGMKTVHMKEVLRQKEQGYRNTVQDLSEKKIDRAFEKLEKQNRIAEATNRNNRLEAIKNDYVSSKGNTIIVTARNADRNELNNRIHDELKEKGKIGKNEHTFTVRENKGLNPTDKHFAQSYSEGDRIVANKAGIIGRAGAEAKVTAVDQLNHRITVQKKNNKQYTIDLKTKGQHLSVYSEKQQAFSQGEKIVFTKNDKGRGIQNGQTAYIKSIDKDGNAKIKMENGKIKDINIRTQYNYIDRGYSVTDYKSQGQTSNRVLYHADTTKETTYNQGYVAMTRGKEDLKVYTDSKENLREQMKHEQVKTSTITHEKHAGKTQEVQKERQGISL